MEKKKSNSYRALLPEDVAAYQRYWGGTNKRPTQQDMQSTYTRIAQDMGLGGFPVKFNEGDFENEEWAGESGISKKGANIAIDTSEPPEARMSTAMHEAAHVDDYLHGWRPGKNYPAAGLGHHDKYDDFEKDLPEKLNAITMVESGIEPASKYKQFPEIKKIRPLSSNYFPSPWGRLK